MKRDLDSVIVQLNNIKGEENHPSRPLPDQSTVEQTCRQIDLQFNTLVQTVENFVHAFEQDIANWGNKPEPKLSGIGSGLRALSTTLDRHTQLNKSLRIAHQESDMLAKDIEVKHSEHSQSQSKVTQQAMDILNNRLNK